MKGGRGRGQPAARWIDSVTRVMKWTFGRLERTDYRP